MGGRGPAPRKPSSAKRRPNSGLAFKRLPHEGRKGDPPPWPLPEITGDPAASAQEAEEWTRLWSLPQAFEWERMQCAPLVALYVRVFVRAMRPGADTKLFGEVRQLDAKIGLSPRAMQDLRWETDEAPPEEDGASLPPEEHAPYVPKAESP